MKKAKIFLSAISIIAIAAGAVAFKSQKFLGTWYCSTVANVPCTITATTTSPTTTGYCTKIYSDPCTVRTSFVVNL